MANPSWEIHRKSNYATAEFALLSAKCPPVPVPVPELELGVIYNTAPYVTLNVVQ